MYLYHDKLINEMDSQDKLDGLTDKFLPDTVDSVTD